MNELAIDILNAFEEDSSLETTCFFIISDCLYINCQ
jgi:hypothetical protein